MTSLLSLDKGVVVDNPKVVQDVTAEEIKNPKEHEKLHLMDKTTNASNLSAGRKPGRPPGSKNKNTLKQLNERTNSFSSINKREEKKQGKELVQIGHVLNKKWNLPQNDDPVR